MKVGRAVGVQEGYTIRAWVSPYYASPIPLAFIVPRLQMSAQCQVSKQDEGEQVETGSSSHSILFLRNLFKKLPKNSKYIPWASRLIPRSSRNTGLRLPRLAQTSYSSPVQLYSDLFNWFFNKIRTLFTWK